MLTTLSILSLDQGKIRRPDQPPDAAPAGASHEEAQRLPRLTRLGRIARRLLNDSDAEREGLSSWPMGSRGVAEKSIG